MSTPLFQKNLGDLIKGIRSHKKNEAEFISKALGEIKQEVRSPDIDTKTTAVQKLTFLHMMGYDMSWAAFHVVEVLSSSKFAHKRAGYLAASQSFNESTDVLVLLTNQMKKEMNSAQQFDVSLALNCLSNICTTDLARDLVSDVVSLLNSTQSNIRKRAVLSLYPIFRKFPDALRPTFVRLRDKFDDAAQNVQAATVTVICELARKNPDNYKSLAPTLYKLLTTTGNNWMLIKLIKLFRDLLAVEPRLAKKLVDPLTNFMNGGTAAKSVLYEAIVCGAELTQFPAVIKLCAEKLHEMLEDSDANLKYLALQGLPLIMKTLPKLVIHHKDTILRCLDDSDVTIRMRALDLLEGITTKKNLKDVVRRLLELAGVSEGDYRSRLLRLVVQLCTEENYARLTDFEWFCQVLVDLSRMPAMQQGKMVRDELVSVAVRVRTVRPFLVGSMLELLGDSKSIVETANMSDGYEVLYAAAYIVGEFAESLDDDDSVAAVTHLLDDNFRSLPGRITACCLQNALKLYARAANGYAAPPSAAAAAARPVEVDLLGDDSFGGVPAPTAQAPAPSSSANGAGAQPRVAPARLAEMSDAIKRRVQTLSLADDPEVQERSCSVLAIFSLLESDAGRASGLSLAALFDEELNPVAAKAQSKVPLPPGLDLDAWINSEPASPSSSGPPSDFEDETGGGGGGGAGGAGGAAKTARDEADAALRRAESQRRRENDPYYLKPSVLSTAVEDIPVQQISKADLGLDDSQHGADSGGGKSSSRHGSSRRGGSGRKGRGSPSPPSRHVVTAVEELPEGASQSDEERASAAAAAAAAAASKKGGKLRPQQQQQQLAAASQRPRDAEADALNVDLSQPLGAGDVLPTIQAYKRVTAEEVIAQMRQKEEEEKARKAEERKQRHARRHKSDAGAEADSKHGRSGHQHKHHKKHHGKGDAAPAAAPAKKEALLIDFSSEPAATGSPSAGEYAALGDSASPAGSSAALASGSGEQAHRSSHHHHHRRSHGDKREGAADAEDNKGHHHKHRHRHSSSTKGEAAAPAAAASSSPAASAAAAVGAVAPGASGAALDVKSLPFKRRVAIAGRTDSCVVSFSVGSVMSQPKQLLLSVTVNNSSTEHLTNVVLSMEDGAAVHPPSKTKLDDIDSLSSVSRELALPFAMFDTVQQLSGTLSFAKDGVPSQSVPLRFTVGCSAFVTPQAVTAADFRDALGSGDLTSLASRSVPRGKRAFKDVVTAISGCAGVAPIEGSERAAAFFGRTLRSAPVAVLCKDQGATLLIEVRAPKPKLAESLAAEVASLFA